MVSRLSPNVNEQVEKGISVLKKGGVVVYPTDTVYGLGAGMVFWKAVERIYAIKERPRTMPLPLLLADISQVDAVAESISPLSRFLMRKFWPGGLTLVLCASSEVPDIVAAGGKTVAVRIPDHAVPIALIRGLGMPIVGTSANLSGQPSPLTADAVYSQLGDRVDLIIDGGRCLGGVESTIVDATGETSVILREGAISRAEIERICREYLRKDLS